MGFARGNCIGIRLHVRLHRDCLSANAGGHWGVSRGLAGMLLALHTATRASRCERALSSLSCVFVFSTRVCYLWRRLQSETHAAAPETHAPEPLHVLEHAASNMRESSLRLRASCWHVCACRQILSGLLTWRSSTKHFACACLALVFCVHWSIFVAGVAYWSAQTSATPSLHGHVVGFCMHARTHTHWDRSIFPHACILCDL